MYYLCGVYVHKYLKLLVMKTKSILIKGINMMLAGALSLLGFAGCQKTDETFLAEYGVPHTDYSVKGMVVNKVTGKPVEGIWVGYRPYDVITAAAYKHVITDAKGEFKLTNHFSPGNVYVEDIDGEENGLFLSENLEVDFSKAVRTEKPKGWYGGEYSVTVNVALTEIEDNTDE